MPLSRQHAALLLLFQNRPQLALELLRELNLETTVTGPASFESVDLTTAVPAEHRTDLVVRYSGRKRPLVVAVEAQLTRDPEKRYSWPAYVVLLRARFRCAEQARAAPELAVLSAMAHGRGDEKQAVAIGLASLSAVETLEPERGMIYFDLVLAALGETARKAIQSMISPGYRWQSDFALKHRAEGEAKGEAKGKAQAVVLVLEARGIALEQSERERILSCGDLTELDEWLRRAATIEDVTELFA